MNTLIKAAFDSAMPDMVSQIAKAQSIYMDTFGDWVASVHRERLSALFVSAGRAKLASLFATTAEDASEEQDIFETLVLSIETVGLADWVVGKAEAIKAMQASMKAILHGLASGFGLAVKAVMGVVLPGIGALGGQVAGPGVTYLLDQLFGSAP